MAIVAVLRIPRLQQKRPHLLPCVQASLGCKGTVSALSDADIPSCRLCSILGKPCKSAVCGCKGRVRGATLLYCCLCWTRGVPCRGPYDNGCKHVHHRRPRRALPDNLSQCYLCRVAWCSAPGCKSRVSSRIASQLLCLKHGVCSQTNPVSGTKDQGRVLISQRRKRKSTAALHGIEKSRGYSAPWKRVCPHCSWVKNFRVVCLFIIRSIPVHNNGYWILRSPC